jgi:hypothetical protein
MAYPPTDPIPEADKPFYLAIAATILTAIFGVVLSVHAPTVDVTQAQAVFTFFAGLLGTSWGYYFGSNSQRMKKTTS